MSPRPLAVLLAVLAVGCDQGSEEAFIRDRAENPCLQAIPACPGLSAACLLDDTNFARRSFPGAFRFVVEADPDSEVRVLMFVAEAQDAGLDTRIYWNEPGCSDVHVYESEGVNLFQESEETRVIQKKEKIDEGGEHLVEIISDMQAHLVIAVEVLEPDS